jgi:biopolymer transport protein ExbB
MFDQISFWLSDITFQVSNFMLLGGDVLTLIAFVIFVMWALIAERTQYFYLRFPQQAQRMQQLWDARSDHHTWQAHQIRTARFGSKHELISIPSRHWWRSVRCLD